mgnify:CR=1 FL=1
MTINNLITNISNALEIPSKIKYNNEIFEYNNDYQDYESIETQDKFLFEYLFSNFRMKTFMYTTVEIIEEDKKMDFEEIEELTCNEYDFKTRTINSLIKNQRKLIDEINNLKKEK